MQDSNFRYLNEVIETEELEKNMTYHQIVIDIDGKDKSFLSYAIKELLLLIGVFVFPTVFFSVAGFDMSGVAVENRYKFILINALLLFIPICSTVVYLSVKYIYRSRFLNGFKHQIIVIGLLEVSLVSYGSLLLFNLFSHLNIFLMLLILVGYFGLSIGLIKNILDTKIKDSLNKHFGKKFKISKLSNYLSRYPAIVLTTIIFGAFFYRTTKSVFISNNNDSPISFLYTLLGGGGFLLIGLSISMLPTLLFDGKLFIRGKLLQCHSEYFRKEYDFTKEEWYGE